MIETDGDELYESPVDVIPGYETDLSAVGTNRVADPEAVDDTPWFEFHDTEGIELTDDVEVRPR